MVEQGLLLKEIWYKYIEATFLFCSAKRLKIPSRKQLLVGFSFYKMNTCNSANSIKLGKLLKRHRLTPKNKQKIIQEAQKDYSNWSDLERLARNLEFKNSVAKQKPNENS